jgi:flagellar biosynthesis protein FliQ
VTVLIAGPWLLTRLIDFTHRVTGAFSLLLI